MQTTSVFAVIPCAEWVVVILAGQWIVLPNKLLHLITFCVIFPIVWMGVAIIWHDYINSAVYIAYINFCGTIPIIAHQNKVNQVFRKVMVLDSFYVVMRLPMGAGKMTHSWSIFCLRVETNCREVCKIKSELQAYVLLPIPWVPTTWGYHTSLRWSCCWLCWSTSKIARCKLLNYYDNIQMVFIPFSNR